MNSLKYFGLSIAAAGLVNPPEDRGYEILSEKHDHNYRRITLKGGIVVGMVFVGNVEKSGIIFGLMKDKINVADSKQALLTDDFGLVSLPEKLWRERVEMPSSELVSPREASSQEL